MDEPIPMDEATANAIMRDAMRTDYAHACTFVCVAEGVALDSTEVKGHGGTGRLFCRYCGHGVCHTKFWPQTPLERVTIWVR